MCGFEDNDRMLRDRIVMDTNDSQLQKTVTGSRKIGLTQGNRYMVRYI